VLLLLQKVISNEMRKLLETAADSFICSEDISCVNYLSDITYGNLLFISFEHTMLEAMRNIELQDRL
jgi:hypothetical protein